MPATVADAVASLALPPPRRDSGSSLEQVLCARHTAREFGASPLRLDELGQLAWAAQGVIASSGRRTAPSAGALYPLELHIVAGQVRDLAAGVYRYEPMAHRLLLVTEGDWRGNLAAAAWNQSWLRQAPAILVVAAIERRTTARYGKRGLRYVLMESGHAAQNVLLQAGALDLDAALVGAFDDGEVHAAAALPHGAKALYLIPVGRPR